MIIEILFRGGLKSGVEEIVQKMNLKFREEKYEKKI